MNTDITHKKEQTQKIIDKAEEINSTTKNFKQYFVDMVLMLDTFYKAQLKCTRSYVGQIVYEDKDKVAIQIGNLQKYFQDTASQSQTKLNELDNNDFNLENIKKGKKIIIENTKNADKQLQKCFDAYNKNKLKYEKQSNEFKQKYQEYKQSQSTGYNITLSKKQETKIRIFIKEIEQQEQLLQQIIFELNSSLKSYQTVLITNFNQMKILFSSSLESILELIKQFANIHYKSVEYVINQLQNHYLPTFIIAERKQIQSHVGSQINDLSFRNTTDQNDQTREASIEQKENFSNLMNSSINGIHSQNQLNQNSQSKISTYSGINFTVTLEKILEKFEISCQNQSEESLRLYYFDQVKQLVDKVKKVIDDKAKNVKNLKLYIQEICESYENIQKHLVKHLANRYLSSNTQISQKYNEILNVLYQVIENFIETFQSLSNFFSIKANSLNSIISEYANMEKALSYLFQKIQRSYQQNNNGLAIQKEYSHQILSTIRNVTNQEMSHSSTIYSILQNLFAEQTKMHEQKQQFLLKAINNVLISEDEVKDQITAFFTKDEQMLDVQEQNESILENKNQNQQNNTFTFQKLFNVPEEFQLEFMEEQEQKKQDELNQISSPLKDSSKLLDSVKISQSLIKKFNVPLNDFVVDSFTCSYSSKISLHGKIYIFNTMIGFHSNFNSRTLIGKI